MLTIGQSIALYRNSRRWTQKRLASEIGIPQSVLSEIENDIVSPKWDIIKAIAASLAVQLKNLLPLKENVSIDLDKEDGKAEMIIAETTQDPMQLLEALLKVKDDLLKAKEETIELLKRQINYS